MNTFLQIINEKKHTKFICNFLVKAGFPVHGIGCIKPVFRLVIPS